MRSLIPVLLVTILFIAAGLWTAHYLEDTANNLLTSMNSIEALVLAQDWDKATIELHKAQKQWNRTKKGWAIVIDHAEIDNIEISLARLLSFSKSKATSDSLAEVAQLKKLITHIPEKEVINLINLL